MRWVVSQLYINPNSHFKVVAMKTQFPDQLIDAFNDNLTISVELIDGTVHQNCKVACNQINMGKELPSSSTKLVMSNGVTIDVNVEEIKNIT